MMTSCAKGVSSPNPESDKDQRPGETSLSNYPKVQTTEETVDSAHFATTSGTAWVEKSYPLRSHSRRANMT